MSDTQAHMETLAIAYLTGQATPEEAAEYNTLFITNPGFRDMVSEIGLWLAPLNEESEEQPLPEGLLGNIMAEIDGTQDPTPALTTSHSDPANDNGVRRWKLSALAASLIAVIAVGSHFITPPTTPTQTDNEQLMALLSDDSQPRLMAIVYDPDTGRVVARLSNITIPDDGDLQLWLIREGAGAPVSLGVLDRAAVDSPIEFEIPKTLQSGTDILAVSLEGLGGSQSAGPEGPVLFTGSVSDLRGNL